MKKIYEIITVLVLIVLGGICIRSSYIHNFYRDYEFSYFVEKIGADYDMKYEDYRNEWGVAPKDLNDNFDYGDFRLGFSNDRLIRIVTFNPSVKILRNDIGIGSPVQEFYEAYEHEYLNYDENRVIIARTEHLMQDGGGVYIQCEVDENQRISKITITDGL